MTAAHAAPSPVRPWVAGLRYQLAHLRLYLTELRQRLPPPLTVPARASLTRRVPGAPIPTGADGAGPAPSGGDGTGPRATMRCPDRGGRITAVPARTAGNPRPRAIPVAPLPVETVVRLPPHIAAWLDRQAQEMRETRAREAACR